MINAVGASKINVRAFDFHSISATTALPTTNALYDLHDFSHMAAVTLHEVLYGNKYQSALSLLRKSYTTLITSPGK